MTPSATPISRKNHVADVTNVIVKIFREPFYIRRILQSKLTASCQSSHSWPFVSNRLRPSCLTVGRKVILWDPRATWKAAHGAIVKFGLNLPRCLFFSQLFWHEVFKSIFCTWPVFKYVIYYCITNISLYSLFCLIGMVSYITAWSLLRMLIHIHFPL